MASELSNRLRRLGRRLTWSHPLLYCPIGVIRHGKKGYVFSRGHRVYISGYPRSGNTFAVKAFQVANPGTEIRSHRHIPTFILVSLKRQCAGMILVRNPLDAAVSWSIYTGEPLLHTLQYYEDYYSVILPHCQSLFIMRFEDVIADFGKVMRAFNARWGTTYNCFEHTAGNTAICMSRIEDAWRHSDGSVRESCVPRPSRERQAMKQAILDSATSSPQAREALRRAQGIYEQFLTAAHRP